MPDYAAPMGANIEAEDDGPPIYAEPFRTAPGNDITTLPPGVPIEGGPPLNVGQLGPEEQYQVGAAVQPQDQPSTGGPVAELRKHADAHLSSPDRVHVVYHVVLTEERGHERVSYRTLLVAPGSPTLLLGKDEDRRRALIIPLTSSADGDFLAIGNRDALGALNGGLSSFGQMALAPPTVAFLPVANSAPVEIKHVRDVWASWVVDSSEGQATPSGCWVTVISEYGDSALAQRMNATPGQVDR